MRTKKEDYPLSPVNPIESLHDMLVQSTERFRNQLALEDLNPTPMPRLSYGELYDQVLKFGAALQNMGLRERDHIAVISENRVQWGITYLAATIFNYVVVPIDSKLKENEIITILHASDAKAAVFSEPFRDMFVEFRSSVTDLNFLIDMDLADQGNGVFSMTTMLCSEIAEKAKEKIPKVDPEEVSVIVFTSGSMGNAKGVMLSQSNICTNIMDMRKMVQLFPGDRFLSVLPIHHTYECTCGLLCPLSAGCSVRYARSLKSVVEDMKRVRPTMLLGVPLLYEKMYRRITAGIKEKKMAAALIPTLRSLSGFLESFGIEEVRRRIFAEIHEKFGGAIRLFIAGGAAVDPKIARGLRSFGFAFLQGYGLTETSPILAVNRPRHFKDEAAGLPLPSVELQIVDKDEHGRGEIIAKAPSVMLGYYKNEKATREVLKEGWFHTGDIGFLDPDGFLHISGRKKNVIVARNGENVYPEELEEKILKVPFVLESVVFSGKNRDGDEEIRAVIVPNAEKFIEYAQAENRELTGQLVEKIIQDEIRKLNQTLPGHQVIRKVEIQEREFEKTTTQKIKRYLLHQEDSTH
jgi:long-chain acyl-CoA synthetase